MRPYSVSQTGAGSTPAFKLDITGSFNVGIGFVVSGTVNFTLEMTWDDPDDSPTWIPHATLAAMTATGYGALDVPCRAIRLTVNSGAGTATMKVIQQDD